MKCWLVVVLLAAGCADGGEDAAAIRRDALTLQHVLARDRSPALMVDVERAVAGRKPVHAATMIEQAVLPAVDAQVAHMRAANLVTVTVRKVQLRLIAALKQRRDGLSDYRAILATGLVDAPETIVALRAQRDAESLLLALDAELSRLRPSSTASNVVQE